MGQESSSEFGGEADIVSGYTYRSRDYVSRQPSFAEIVSRVAVYFRYTAILIEPSKILYPRPYLAQITLAR